MAAKTGNTYTSGTMTDVMTIPTANLGFSTTPSSKKLTPSPCDKTDNRHGYMDILGANLAISDSRSLSQSFG